jgi:hypothetical protein
MNLVSLLFGKTRHADAIVSEPPDDVEWRLARPKPNQRAVRARRAEADCTVTTAHGQLQARGGKDYIVTYDLDDHAVIDAEIFERTYKSLGSGLFRKRSDIVLRFFTLDYPAVVETKEGEQRAAAGDWIMQGVAGELWPVPSDKALTKYDPI